MKTFSRRSLLKHFVLAALVGALPAPLRRAKAGATAETLATHLASCLSSPAGARRVGTSYLAIAPEEANRGRLALRIAGGTARARWLAMLEGPDLRRWLASQQRRDFAAARTVEVAGWVLSQTEARLCALAALEHRMKLDG